MNWEKVELGELGEFRNGLNYSRANEGAGLKVISVKNFGDLRTPDYSSLDEIDPNGVNTSKSRLKSGDILFVRSNGNKDLIGRSMYVEEDRPDVSYSGFCIRFRNQSEKSQPKFLAYYFRAPIFRRTLSNLGGGTNINNLNQGVLSSFPIMLPPLEAQEAIVGAISAYDDLIENNQRRIALLEQAARLLYREWFVHFRFPGHETAKSVNALPDGWTEKTVFDVVDVLSGGTPKTGNSEYWGRDIGFFTPKDTGDNLYTYNTEKMITEEGLKNCNSRLYEKNTIFITARGTVGKIRMAQRPMAMNQSCYALVTKTELTQQFLYFAISDRVNHLKGRAAGAVFDAIVVDTFKKIPLIIPAPDLAAKFTKIAADTLAQIDNLSSQNRELTKARDLVLPRLMDGRIPVKV